MGLSRNKVAVPEGAAGTPPFWRRKEDSCRSSTEAQAEVKTDKEHLLSGGTALKVRSTWQVLIIQCFLYAESVLDKIKGKRKPGDKKKPSGLNRTPEHSPIAQLVRAPH